MVNLGDEMEPQVAEAEALATYRHKRDFGRTPEPSGEVPRVEPGVRRFVVQRHRASRLHYDFRLEINGALASWAVPKGPSMDPKARRLAVHVEDHPLDYFDFEGVIPGGNYGAGDVIVWDWGTWEPGEDEDPGEAVAAGELHVHLDGTKLRGQFMLVRTDRPGTKSSTTGKKPTGKEQWLLFHKRDEHAVSGWEAETFPHSVKSGLTNDDLHAAADAPRWHSNRSSANPPAAFRAATSPELDSLAALGAAGEWSVNGRNVRLTNLDKVLFPAGDGHDASTKRDLIRYYACIAPYLLPHLVDRALNLRRFPDGVAGKGFWHKEVPTHAPPWLSRWVNPDADPGETTVYTVADHTAALVWLANFGAVELHPWTSETTHHDRPTFALIDIDPGPKTTWDEVLVIARLYRTALAHLGVEGVPKVTGQRGVQIWIPIEPGPTFTDTREWVEKLSRAVGATVPELVSWEWEVSRRSGLARLDYTQNAINKTLVAPYSVRAAPTAPVSVPIDWDELDDPQLRPTRWTIHTLFERLERTGDGFARALLHDQHLPTL